MKKFFERLFGNNQSSNMDVPTKPLARSDQELIPIVAGAPLEPPQFIVGCALSVGMQRDHNEDSLFTLATNLTNEQNYLPFGLFIVADGMGGHQHGEIASGVAVRTLASYLIRKLYLPLLSQPPNPPNESLQEIMQEGVQEAHRAIRKVISGGGTTLTAAVLFGSQMVLAHVGDSRAYLIHPGGEVALLTRDHSLVKRLIELGQITLEEAAIHPQRNVLYRALGQGEPFDPDIQTMHLPQAGHLLLCSDGLWNMVGESEIHSIVYNTPEPEIACQKLVAAANKAGGPDNISAILVRLPQS